jgi:hypothetical protein
MRAAATLPPRSRLRSAAAAVPDNTARAGCPHCARSRTHASHRCQLALRASPRPLAALPPRSAAPRSNPRPPPSSRATPRGLSTMPCMPCHAYSTPCRAMSSTPPCQSTSCLAATRPTSLAPTPPQWIGSLHNTHITPLTRGL